MLMEMLNPIRTIHTRVPLFSFPSGSRYSRKHVSGADIFLLAQVRHENISALPQRINPQMYFIGFE